jgi:hypothetical protein
MNRYPRILLFLDFDKEPGKLCNSKIRTPHTQQMQPLSQKNPNALDSFNEPIFTSVGRSLRSFYWKVYC